MIEDSPAKNFFTARRKRGLAWSSETDRGDAREHPLRLTKKFPERKVKKVDAQYLSAAALFYLQRFAASRARLQEVLLRKVAQRLQLNSPTAEAVCVWLPEIEKLLDRYEEAGLINDAALADARVAGMRRGGGSARGITQKLRQKGLGVEVVVAALEKYTEAEGLDDTDALQQFMKKKKFGPYRATTVAADEKRLKKEITALLRAGFGYQLVKAVLKMDKYRDAQDC